MLIRHSKYSQKYTPTNYFFGDFAHWVNFSIKKIIFIVLIISSTGRFRQTDNLQHRIEKYSNFMETTTNTKWWYYELHCHRVCWL